MHACRSFVWFLLLLPGLPALAPPASAAAPGSPQQPPARVDDFGDPLPPSAVARIGTVRLRQPSEVCSVAFSPDGKLLATGARWDGVRLWDSATGKLIRFLPAKGGQGIFYLAFSPDGKVLISSGFAGALEVWDVTTGKRSQQLGGKSADLGPLCFTDDGKLLAVADGKIMRVWETATWVELPRPDDKKTALVSFAGKRMYVGTEMGKAYLWDLTMLEARLVPDAWRINFWAALSPNGKRLAMAGWQSTLVVLRDVASGKELHRLELAGAKGAMVRALCYSPDGKRLAIAGRRIPMRCVDSETAKETVKFGDQEVDYDTQLAFSPDGKRLAAARRNAVRVWDVATGKELLPSDRLLYGVRALAVSPGGQQLIIADGECLRMYDLATRKEIWKCTGEERDDTYHIAFAPDGKTFVAGYVSRLRFHDAVTGKIRHTWGRGLPGFPRPGDAIEVGLFTPDLDKVVSLRIAAFADPDTDFCVCSAATGKELLKFQRLGDEATAASISPDGRFLAIGDRKAPIRLYRLTTGKKVAELDVPGTEWHALAFAPDGKTLASSDRNGGLHLVEVATGKLRLVLAEAAGYFIFSPDWDVLAVCLGNVVELWDVLTGKKLGRLEGHQGRLAGAAFVPGSNLLATASDDTTILFWDVADLVGKKKPVKLDPKVLTSAWEHLADPNAAQAYRAMVSLRQAGSQAVDFLRERLRPEPMPAAKDIEHWLQDLDAAKFAVRDQATQELKKHLDVVAPALRKALAVGPTLEMHQRLTQLLDLAEEWRWPPEALRTLRAMEVLEHIGSEEARAVLKTLAGGAPDARLTHEARASLERLAR
jgi:WD40 repeat protein